MSRLLTHPVLLVIGLNILLAGISIIPVLTTPDMRPPRQKFERLCAKELDRLKDLTEGRVIRAVTFNYNTRGGKTPNRADFSSFTISYNKVSLKTTGSCQFKDNNGIPSFIIENIKTVQ
ncbi:hypothetical protein [Deinococcus seoulensis]|uniref:hypothetical protein n=1 Tax=Deinococcus seoulensis TaxID=1837379 RepID=UPI0016695731|nr:hypothetical protein [Deinococcus seoulensis]